MRALQVLTKSIDALTSVIGKLALWAILLSTLTAVLNALLRYAFDAGNNALLEIQWYLFAGVFCLGAGYGFLHNVHVRIDFISHRLSARNRNWIDVLGILVFLLPFCILMIVLGWPLFVSAYLSQETSFNPGGLIRWPLYAFIPFGFGLLALQAVSELIKRLQFLFADGADVIAHDHHDDVTE